MALIAAQDMTARSAVAQQPTPSATLVPSARGGHRLVIRADEYNQCYVKATAGTKAAQFRFLLDTGADGVTFGSQHISQLGVKASTLHYDGEPKFTANGIIRAAQIRLRELRIGKFILRDIPANIVPGNLAVPLLGSTVLGKLLDFQLRDGSCVLAEPAAKDVRHGKSSIRSARHYRQASLR